MALGHCNRLAVESFVRQVQRAPAAAESAAAGAPETDHEAFIAASLAKLWEAIAYPSSPSSVCGLSRDAYIRLHMALLRALRTSFDEKSATEAAEADWATDSKGQAAISAKAYARSILGLAEKCVPGQRYAAILLACLVRCVTEEEVGLPATGWRRRCLRPWQSVPLGACLPALRRIRQAADSDPTCASPARRRSAESAPQAPPPPPPAERKGRGAADPGLALRRLAAANAARRMWPQLQPSS